MFALSSKGRAETVCEMEKKESANGDGEKKKRNVRKKSQENEMSACGENGGEVNDDGGAGGDGDWNVSCVCQDLKWFLLCRERKMKTK